MNKTNSSQIKGLYQTKSQWFEMFGSSLTLDSLILFLTKTSKSGWHHTKHAQDSQESHKNYNLQ